MRQSVDWCGSGAGLVRQVVWAAESGLQAVCNVRLLRASNLCEHQTKVVFDLKFMVGGGEHKVVFDKSGFRGYCVGVDYGLKSYPSAS